MIIPSIRFLDLLLITLIHQTGLDINYKKKKKKELGKPRMQILNLVIWGTKNANKNKR